MKSKQKMFMKIFIKTKICLILDSKFFDPINKKVIDKMKDEFKGRIISELIN